jgi:RimJ/RimL family protein N-acetyltransferase
MMSDLTLETKRLLLRQWRPEDIDPYIEICSDAQVMQYLTGKAFNRLQSWRHMAFLMGHWQINGFGHWAVEEKNSGQLIGRIGFLQPTDWPGFEIGWTLAKNSWGKGYATEGATKALEHAFTKMNKSQVISIIHPNNEPSKKVATELGETYSHDITLSNIKVQIWSIDKQTYFSNVRDMSR